MTAEHQAIASKSNGGTRRHTVLVTAAGGHQGKLLIPKLVGAGFVVRAVRATAGKEEEILKLGASEVIVADISDVDAYEAAMTGMDTVYHVGPGAHLREHQMGVALVEAARVAGVRHVVLSSVLHPIIDILQHRIKRDLEEMLIESDLNFTVLKPAIS